ncbi:hypothetical protein GQ53DRAFT_741830 [Thozetella sp. PMI_491]|nr:hypothetical protein GQ53DRAFT_741830 [Thozetella sp. PMI_491]
MSVEHALFTIWYAAWLVYVACHSVLVILLGILGLLITKTLLHALFDKYTGEPNA